MLSLQEVNVMSSEVMETRLCVSLCVCVLVHKNMHLLQERKEVKHILDLS